VQLTEKNSTLRHQLINLAQKEAWARHFTEHDELTGLPNRQLLLNRLAQAIALAKRQGRHVVLLFFNLHGFKNINDELGRTAGDRLLRETALRLQFSLRSADVAARVGRNEFVVMLSEIDGDEGASSVERKLRTRMDQPYVVERQILPLSVTVGRAIYPTDGMDHGDLIKQAGGAAGTKSKNGALRVWEGEGGKLAAFSGQTLPHDDNASILLGAVYDRRRPVSKRWPRWKRRLRQEG
jgi:diguanylate cyclase (GGDEF)-like protein